MERSGQSPPSGGETNDDQIVVSSPRGHVLSDVDQANHRIEMLEEQLLEARGQVAQTRSNNEKLTITIQQTRDQISALRDEVEKVTQRPAVYVTFVYFGCGGAATCV